MPELTRRGLIAGLGALMVAPAIVKVENIMPVKVIQLRERVLSFGLGPGDGLYWRALPGSELCCTSGMKLHDVTWTNTSNETRFFSIDRNPRTGRLQLPKGADQIYTVEFGNRIYVGNNEQHFYSTDREPDGEVLLLPKV